MEERWGPREQGLADPVEADRELGRVDEVGLERWGRNSEWSFDHGSEFFFWFNL